MRWRGGGALLLVGAAALGACSAGRSPGEPCSGPRDCASGICLIGGEGGSVCTRSCGSNADCPGGLVCQPVDLSGEAGIEVQRICIYPLPNDGGEDDADVPDAADVPMEPDGSDAPDGGDAPESDAGSAMG